MTHDPLPVICSYSAIACFGKRIRGVHPPKVQRVGPGHKHLKFLTKIGKRINNHINFMKICMTFVPVFAGHTYGIDAPESEVIFIFFRKSSQPETNQIC